MDRTYYDDVTSVFLSYDATQEMISKLFSRESDYFILNTISKKCISNNLLAIEFRVQLAQTETYEAK